MDAPKTPATLSHIQDHANRIVPLTNLLGVMLLIHGEEALLEIAPGDVAPAYLLIFLDQPLPTSGTSTS